MKYFFFHFMQWPYLPDDFDAKYDSAWVWLSNSMYDPVKGHELYREYINTLAYAEELGFDGICVNEHHQNAYGLMPSPNVIAGALTQRTQRVKIAVIGNALPLYHPPLRVAEEFAMLDVLSCGRLIAGMVIGGGPETIEFVAQRRYAYMGVPYFHISTFRRVFAQFREACDRAGYTARPEQMGWGVPTYVAETDRQAREEFEPHMWYFVRNLLKGIGLSPPGYTSAKSALAIIKNHGSFLATQKSWDDIEKGVFAIVGSPETVRQKLDQYRKELGVGVVLTGCQTGTLPHELARKSMALLAREVLPHVRDVQEAEVRRAEIGRAHV